MMQRRHLLLAAGLAAATGAARAQTMITDASAPMRVGYTPEDLQHAARLRTEGLADTEAWALVQQLTRDIGARPAGSAADAKAVAWAQAAMRRLALHNVRAEAMQMKVWQRGSASAQLVAPVKETLVMAALGGSTATPDAGIEADVAWYPDFAALKADTSDRARGKIVFIDQKMERFRDGSGYGPAVMARGNGAVEAGKRGALAVGIRSIGTDTDRVAHTGGMRYEIGVPKVPAFAVSIADATRLAALNAEGKPLRLRLMLQSKSDVEATSHNVIGEVPGTDLAGEIVLIGAHLDSWDLGPGAQDDGAGVAIVTAAAALLQRAGRKPRRTIRVVLFANEENGFDGVRAYSERYKDVAHQMVGESDFGAGRVYELKSRVQEPALHLITAIQQQLEPLGVAWPGAGAGGNQGSPGPDAAFLMRRHRWPGIALNQDGTGYFDIHHTANDTLDRIDPKAMSQNVACWAVTAWLAAQAPLSFGPPTL